MKQNQLNKLKNSQGLRFAIIGGGNTILDFVILFGLTGFGMNSVLANIFSTGITFISSFVLNKKYTFQSEKRTRSELIREITLFTIVTLFGLWVIQSAIIALLSPLANSILNNDSLALLFVKAVATGFSLVWNFVLYKKVVFAKTK